MHFTRCTSLYALDSMHFTPCTSLYVVGSEGSAWKNPSRCFREKSHHACKKLGKADQVPTRPVDSARAPRALKMPLVPTRPVDGERGGKGGSEGRAGRGWLPKCRTAPFQNPFEKLNAAPEVRAHAAESHSQDSKARAGDLREVLALAAEGALRALCSGAQRCAACGECCAARGDAKRELRQEAEIKEEAEREGDWKGENGEKGRSSAKNRSVRARKRR